MNNYSKKSGTFSLNKDTPIHRWYPYLEGYSSCLIDDLILEIGAENIEKIYDPFCGSGTTALVSSKYGIDSYYSEINPFMQLVIDSKINCVKKLRDSGIGSKFLIDFLKQIKDNYNPKSIDSWDGFEKYFDQTVLNDVLYIKEQISFIENLESRKIALVILASIIIRVSNLTRWGNIRFAKEGEKSESDKKVMEIYSDKLRYAISDIDNSDEFPIKSYSHFLCNDCRDIDIENSFDCVITSPPYLNGTDYIKNSRVELKLTDFVQSAKDLYKFYSEGVVSAISNVSKRTGEIKVLDCIKEYMDALIPVAYDVRIPKIVSGYFYGMNKVIEKISKAMKNDRWFIMDIGDSQFAGVHIPTHYVLTEICKNHNLILQSQKILRKRISKNGMTLTQRLMKFKTDKPC